MIHQMMLSVVVVALGAFPKQGARCKLPKSPAISIDVIQPASDLKSQRFESLQVQFRFIFTLFSTDLETILVAISLALCDFKWPWFEIVATPICELVGV